MSFGVTNTEVVVERIRTLAHRSFNTVAERFGDGIESGALSIVGYEEGPLLFEAINEKDKKTAQKLVHRSMTQASLLQVSSLARTSWQCTDTQGKRAGGAIEFRRWYILSFAGFSERTNEAFCVALARACGYLREGEIETITNISDNHEHVAEVLNVVNDFL